LGRCNYYKGETSEDAVGTLPNKTHYKSSTSLSEGLNERRDPKGGEEDNHKRDSDLSTI
jgi:hypothetical protein